MKVLFIFLAIAISAALGSYEQVQLTNNGYTGMVIAINPEVTEDPDLIDSLKTIWTDASTALYQGTKKRAYFKDITILVPTNWDKGTYQAAGKVSYDSADVLVANANPAFGDKPYTLQFGECGAHGEYIHLTPEYITQDKHVENYGPKGKTMVHEWAHLRWGVFDESASEGYPEFYYGKDNQLEATRCPASLKGENVHIYESEGNILGEECEIDIQTGFPVNGECRFIPNEEQDPEISTSMMSHYYLDQVVHFCHDDESDPANKHNKEAPNEQNRLCSQRSTWDVIQSSEDFDGKNFESSISDLAPNFNVVQAKANRKYVLVLDTSGSMSSQNLDRTATRMQNAITASAEFITNYAPNNSYVGIVDFDSYARINSNLKLLRTDQDRKNLVGDLPTLSDANGGTDLSVGADLAVDMLVDSGNTEGTEILMLTDGEGYWSPTSATSIKAKGILFTTIFFGVNDGNDFLIQLSEETNGLWTMANDLEVLLDTFEKVSHVDSGSTADKSFQVKSESVFVSGSDVTGSVSIDSSIGGNTVFSFSYSGSNAPYIDLYEPSGRKFCSDNHYPSGCDATTKGTVDSIFKTITFKIAGMAKSGTWTYNMHPTSSYSTTVTASVSSMAADPNVPPITVKSGMSTTGISSASPIVVYAQITQGFKPILNAEARATVTHPNGATTELILQDHGAAPDVRKSDGIYSKYFLDYSVSGRYSVKVQVIGRGNETLTNSTSASSPTSSASFNYGIVKPDGTIVLNQNYETDEDKYVVDAKDLDSFERVDSLGGFEYTGPHLSEAVDSFPPSQIIDLQAEQVNVDDVEEGFRLLFTASGDDYDEGTAWQYKIHYTLNDTSLLVPEFDSLPQLQNTSILSGDLESPKPAGSEEMFVVKIDDLPKTDQVLKVGFAVRAYDETGNFGGVSNVALLNLFMVSPKELLNPCIGEKGEIFFGQLYPVPGDCNKFYQCDVTGQPIEMKCQEGLAFNPINHVCDYPANVPDCNHSTDNVHSVEDLCKNADGSFKDGFVVDSADCQVYQCSNGIPYEFNCQPGLEFNPDTNVCDWPSNVETCVPGSSTDPSASGGSSTTPRPPPPPSTDKPAAKEICVNDDGSLNDEMVYLNATDCQYYKCHQGISQNIVCPEDMSYDPKRGVCEWDSNLSDSCNPNPNSNQSIIQAPVACSEGPHTTTPTPPSGKTTLKPGAGEKTTAGINTGENTTLKPGTGDKTTAGTSTGEWTTQKPNTEDKTTVGTSTGEWTTQKPNTEDKTTDTSTPGGSPINEVVPEGDSFIGFVIDDTGSMSYEIEAVKTWLTNCVEGSYDDCAIPPTGGWILSTFNDPSIGTVVGPSTDLTVITSAIGELSAHGGGDCPERAFAGLISAVSVVEEVNSGCKIFFFSDAIANDEGYYDELKALFVKKGCSFIPMLTGCCGTCEDPCISIDPEYCINNVVDKTTTTLSLKKSAKSLLTSEELFYDLASSSGGTIYLTDKPTSSDDFLEFLEDEVTLGFCPTDEIAGPPPLGYTNEMDCNSTRSCWDHSKSKCYCQSLTDCPKYPITTTPAVTTPAPTTPSLASKCDLESEHSFVSDPKDCSKYYECSNGQMWHRDCAPETVFDDILSVCNYPSDVPPPCGTKV